MTSNIPLADQILFMHPMLIGQAFPVTYGLPADGPISCIEYEYGKHQRITVTGIKTIDMMALRPDGVTAEDWRTTIDRKFIGVAAFFRDQFKATIERFQRYGSDRGLEIRFTTRDFTPGNGLSFTDLYSALMSETLIEQLGTLNISALLTTYLENYLDLKESVLSSRDVTEYDVDRQVSFRLGENELDDRVAIAGAALLVQRRREQDCKAIRELGRIGVFAQKDLAAEIGAIYKDLTVSEKNFASMLGTWAIAKTRTNETPEQSHDYCIG